MSRSWFSSRNRASTMSRMMTENGSAVMMRTFCRASRPPTMSRTAPRTDSRRPQITFVRLCGSRLPSSEIMPRTNVAESAEVTKNEMMSSTDRIDRGLSRGYWASVPNSTLSVGSEARSAPLIWAEVERVPKVANQMQLKTVGMRMTPQQELPDRAAPRDARDEDAHERRPGDPPRPVEDRPAPDPGLVGRVVGGDGQAHAREVLRVVADRRHEGVEDLRGRPDDDAHRHEGRWRGRRSDWTGA